MRFRIPWSELAALLAAYVALVAWSSAPARVTLEGAATLFLALTAALAPRRALASRSPAAAEGAAIAGALAALAIAPTVTGSVPPSPTLGILHATAVAEVLAVATALALALPLRPRTLRRAALPAVAVGALAAVALWPSLARPHGLILLRRLAPVAGGLVTLAYAYALRRPASPIDRARLVVPGLGSSALALSLGVWAWWGPGVSPVILAGGLTAQVIGLTLGTGAIALEHASAAGRRMVATGVGFVSGVVALALAPTLPALAVAVGALVMLAVLPVAERYLRPDGGALLDACDAIERALPRVQTLPDLASVVLDPLRLAVHDLQTSGALWVIDRQETLHVDVAGTPTVFRLSLDAERSVIIWLRTHPAPLFSDALRPHLVRRAELRPVVSALDAHDALAALALHDDTELSGVLLIPRGRRMAPPTYEEEVRLAALARTVAGVLSFVSALDRAHDRTRAAVDARGHAESQAADAIAARDHAVENSSIPQSTRVLGSLEHAWVGYSPAMRELAQHVAGCASESSPIALVAEPGSGAIAIARTIHCQGPRAKTPFVVANAASVHSGDVVASLVGDARTDPVRPGWLELAADGTLVIDELSAMGHDALVALHDALRTATARRLGGMASYPVTARLIVVVRHPPETLDLPVELIARLAPRVFRVPPLRARGEDMESLVLAGIDRACRVLGRPTLGVAPDALAALRTNNWPSNLDGLRDALEHAAARARGTRVTLGDLPPAIRVLVGSAATDAPVDDEGADDLYDG